MANTYTSGGLNDTTGREPFEDNSRDFIGQGSTGATGQFGDTGATTGHHDHHHHHHQQQNLGEGDLSGEGVTGGSAFNTGGVGNYSTNTGLDSGVDRTSYSGQGFGGTGAGRLAGDTYGLGGTGDAQQFGSTDIRSEGTGGGLTGDSYGFTGATGPGGAASALTTGEGYSSKGRAAGYNDTNTGGQGGASGLTGDTLAGGNSTGDVAGGYLGATGGSNYGSDRAAAQYERDTSGLGSGQTRGSGNDENTPDLSAGHGRSVGGPGNMGVSDYQGSASGPISSGAAGTDRFDAGEPLAREGSGHYGQADAEKNQTNHSVSRHGHDFTGGHTATGGAYTNEYAKTGLTGRETTTTGVPDQQGERTQNQSLLDKVKHAVGIHKSDDVPARSADAQNTQTSDYNA